MCINGLWGDICDDVTDQTTLARIFCRQFIGQQFPCKFRCLCLIPCNNIICFMLKHQKHMSCLRVVLEQGKETLEIQLSMVSAVLIAIRHLFRIALTDLCLVIQQMGVLLLKNSSLVASNSQVVQVVIYV